MVISFVHGLCLLRMSPSLLETRSLALYILNPADFECVLFYFIIICTVTGAMGVLTNLISLAINSRPIFTTVIFAALFGCYYSVRSITELFIPYPSIATHLLL